MAVIDGQVRLEDAVEAREPQQLVLRVLHLGRRSGELVVRRAADVRHAEGRRDAHVDVLLDPQLGQPAADGVGVEGVLVGVLGQMIFSLGAAIVATQPAAASMQAISA